VLLNFIFLAEFLPIKTFTDLNRLTVASAVQLPLNYFQAYLFAKELLKSAYIVRKTFSLLTDIQRIFGIFRAISKFQNFEIFVFIPRFLAEPWLGNTGLDCDTVLQFCS
jgi:hypothetical protein